MTVLKLASFTNNFDPINLFLYLLSPIFTVYILYVFMKISMAYDLREFTVQIVASMICLAIINLFTIVLFEISNRNAESKRKYELLQQEINSERENYQGIIKASEQLHELKHDIKNHLIYIRKVIDENNIDKAEEYIEKVTADIQETEKYMVTGNKTLDCILSSKISENQDIVFICAGDSFNMLNKMDELDVAVLFGNILDNAAERLKEEEDKTVEIRATMFNSFFNLNVSNYISESILESNPKLLTTKKDSAQHGWGLRSVRSIVEKYSGMLDCYEKNNRFTVHIVIPMEAEDGLGTDK